MNRLIVVVLAAAFLMITVPAVQAYQYTFEINRFPGYFQTGFEGGEFSIRPISGFGNTLSLYDADAKNSQGTYFETFCLEKNEYVNIPGTYYANLNSEALNGGQGGPHPDPISVGTAWLYNQFRLGILTDYDYNTLGNRAADARALQEAIWWLEGELSYDPITNEFRNAVVAYFGSVLAAMADNNWQIPVGVLNLYDGNDGRHQDQLVAVPEPGIILLLGFGLAGIGILRRKS